MNTDLIKMSAWTWYKDKMLTITKFKSLQIQRRVPEKILAIKIHFFLFFYLFQFFKKTGNEIILK